MISTSNKNRILLIALLLALFFPYSLFAQNSVSLSVTPTLFDMSANPEQEWKSAVKVINSNPFPLTVYANPVNFQPQGEGGTGKFLPVFEEFSEGLTLAEWIDINREAVTIPPEKSQEIPFTVRVPREASPGGHFAAIMVGTQPPESDEGQMSVKTAQVVTSLLFVRIAGDVLESGSIREFRVADRFVSRPATDFELRFENKGNVHLQPQGEIKVFNMWGKERGVIPINHQTHFGNVLPESIRQFRFSWEGDWSFTEIGRYSAVVTLGFGEEKKQFTTSKTYFWVVPVKAVLMTIFALVALFFFVSLLVKLYVRRMLIMAGVDPSYRAPGRGPAPYDPEAVKVSGYKEITAPVSAGYVDLRSRLRDAAELKEKFVSLIQFVIAYKIFFGSLLVLLFSGWGLYWYVSDATTEQRAYEVTIENPDTTVTVTSEDVLYEEYSDTSPQKAPATSEFSTTTDTHISVSVVNISGEPGKGALAKILLENNGYQVGSVSTDFDREEERSIVVFNVSEQSKALEISKLLEGALLSARTEDDTDHPIRLFVGKDIVVE